MSDIVRRKVVRVHIDDSCYKHRHDGVLHVSRLEFEDGSECSDEDAIAMLKAGAGLFMTPPPGAPAHAMHVATGLDLILQWRVCPACRSEVLFA